MNKGKYIRIIALGIMLALCSQAGFAQRYYNQTYKPKRSTGSTRTAQGVLQQGLSFGINAIYYFGDVDIGKLPVVNGMSINEMSGSGYVAYHMPFSKNFGMRYTGTIGLLKADNTEAWKNDPVHTGEFRKFTSVFLQPAVGVEAYPIQEYGLYFYLGISATASYLMEFSYSRMEADGGQRPDFGFLPMGQASFGYTWNLTSSWQIDLHAMLQMGFIDQPVFNLDGYPFNKGMKANRWPDGWFEIGVSIHYGALKRLPALRN